MLVIVGPAASATGWLINVEENLVTGTNLEFGKNVFGGQGDTVDILVFGTQCSDEDDVVDVTLMSNEGYYYDSNTGRTCEPSECHSPHGPLGFPALFQDHQECQGPQNPCVAEEGHWYGLDPIFDPIYDRVLGAQQQQRHPNQPHCSDDEDTADVSVLTVEGQAGDCPFFPDKPRTAENSGDRHDAVDVGVLNEENCDRHDAVDVGAHNCEYWDDGDGLDVGVINQELGWDHEDVFDVSLFNTEMNDGPDHNGLNTPFVVAPLFKCDPHQFFGPPP